MVTIARAWAVPSVLRQKSGAFSLDSAGMNP